MIDLDVEEAPSATRPNSTQRPPHDKSASRSTLSSSGTGRGKGAKDEAFGPSEFRRVEVLIDPRRRSAGPRPEQVEWPEPTTDSVRVSSYASFASTPEEIATPSVQAVPSVSMIERQDGVRDTTGDASHAMDTLLKKLGDNSPTDGSEISEQIPTMSRTPSTPLEVLQNTIDPQEDDIEEVSSSHDGRGWSLSRKSTGKRSHTRNSQEHHLKKRVKRDDSPSVVEDSDKGSSKDNSADELQSGNNLQLSPSREVSRFFHRGNVDDALGVRRSGIGGSRAVQLTIANASTTQSGTRNDGNDAKVSRSSGRDHHETQQAWSLRRYKSPRLHLDRLDMHYDVDATAYRFSRRGAPVTDPTKGEPLINAKKIHKATHGSQNCCFIKVEGARVGNAPCSYQLEFMEPQSASHFLIHLRKVVQGNLAVLSKTE